MRVSIASGLRGVRGDFHRVRKRGSEQTSGGLRSRFPSVAESPQIAELGKPSAQAGEAELGLHAALGAQQLVPFVDDDAAAGARVFPGSPRG